MKIMFIVYHDIRTNARSQEILECSKKIGYTFFVSYSKLIHEKNYNFILTGRGKRNYFTFIRDSIKAIKTKRPDIVILHDNYTALILRWILKYRKNIFIIFDSSELYINVKPKSLKMLIAYHMNYFEKKYLKYADIVIAPNIERANIMKHYYKLNRLPIVFNNIHRINDNYNILECNKKYGKYFNDGAFCIVYGGGIGKQRMTYVLANAVCTLGSNYRLLIVGRSNKAEKKKIDLMIRNRNYKNIFYLGFISRNEWRFLLNQAKVSVVAFTKDTVNNKYCASGKLYESLFEGTPLLTSDNPPLKRICDDYQIGVSTRDFAEGILELEKKYDFYCDNVNSYIKNLNVERRLDHLVKVVKERIRNSNKLK
jgi:hypothetical protein